VCTKGFFLSEQNKCLPCNCKGHAVHCEDITGICFNCSDHSMGDFCEMCEDGYMLAPSQVGRHSCQPCACPLFAVHCDRQGDIQRCKCKEGYAGHICECAPGYYGMPMTVGGSCKRCDCNDNSDPNLIFNWCHNVTGHCQHCWGNTGGPNCERCAQGFYGDAIGAKNCRCECNKCGTSSCDDRTGVCHCKPGVTGRLCDRCEEGYSGFSSCQGCHRCECRPASLRPTCHSLTHSCLCRPGAGGRYCERCLPGFWDYSASGCKCDCESGHCDMQTGECLPEPATVNLCNICDECIWHVIGDLRLSNKTLDHLRVGVLNISTGAAVNDRVKYYNYTAQHLQEKTAKSLGNQLDEDTLQNLMHAEHFSKNLTDLNMRIELRRIRQLEKKSLITHGHLNPLKLALSRVTAKLSDAQSFLRNATSTIEEMRDRNSGNVLKFQRIEYHAAIDGASQKLTEKMEQLSSADTELIRRADEHAEELEQRATKLEDLRESDTNGFVQKAISAANVYTNIVKYINNANITSLTTLNLSHTEVVDKLKYIEETKETLDKNTKKLEEMMQDISEIETTNKRLEYTLNVAEGTLNRSAAVLETITPISNKVEEWANNLSENKYSTAAYEQAIDSAKESDHLQFLVPELLDKLKVVEQKKPVNNITANVMRIRELIAQARSVAKKVQVSMKFNGQSSVEIHADTNLEDLKAVTSISLFMRVDPDQDPIEDRFILYLGDKNGRKDYMGLAIKNDNLVYMYNLGGEYVEIPLSSKPVSQWPAVFNYIKVELGRHGKIYLVIPSQRSTDEQKFIQKGEAPGTDSLFDIDPKDMVFFVGGVPPDAKVPPPLTLAPFVGCIELASLNNDVISLYNFKNTHKMDVAKSTPCSYKLAFSQSRIASYLFDGKGYALINNIERRGKFGYVTRFDVSVRTVANNGGLFIMVNADKFFLLEIKNGYLRLMYDFGFNDGPKLLDDHIPKLKINDARYHEISVIYHQSKKVILLVDKSHVKSMENPKTTLPFSDIYIGGAPSHILLSPELSAVVGLKGCVKGFLFQKKDFNLLEEPGTIGISSGCPEESFSHKAYFMGESYLKSSAKISPFDNFEGGLNFRTVQASGVLFYHNEGSDEFSISLENGAVVMNSHGTRVKTHKKHYNDGRTHFLLASVNNQDKDKQEKIRPQSVTRPSSVSTGKNFYFGGSPKSSLKNFTGCISYAYINRQDRDIEPEDFQRYTENVQALLQDCPLQKPPAVLSTRHRDDKSIAKRRVSRKSNFSLSLKTNASFGLIFYVSDIHERNFMTLFLASGRLVYTFNVGDQRVEIWSEENYNDGAWHNVIFIRDGSMGKLIVDGLTVLEDRVKGKAVPWHVSSPLYFGGVPPKRAQKNIQGNSVNSFSGCLRNIQLNGHWLSSADKTFGVTPCFEGLTEAGTFFAVEGGYVLLDLGPRFQLEMEVRPQVTSGLLLHVPRAEGYFSLYIHQVVAVLTDGTHELLATVSPRRALCAGHWHRIAEPYVGCMRNLKINNSGVSFTDVALVSGAVSVGSC
uniref:Laminin subunit alpha 4 n=1 Tax=Hippocampus comes TaxID=109280 RepID=A0A3Q2YDE3_HIPCM